MQTVDKEKDRLKEVDTHCNHDVISYIEFQWFSLPAYSAQFLDSIELHTTDRVRNRITLSVISYIA